MIVGAVLEIGIEPTARHAADLGLLPVVVTDACGAVARSRRRSIASLDYSLLSYCATATAPRPRSSTPSEPDDPDHSIRLPACGFQKSCTER